MKNAVIVHGRDGSPNDFWYPFAKNGLLSLGYEVWVPQLPDRATPNLETQLPFLLREGRFTSDTVVIAHSAGAPLVLALLENVTSKMKQVILVAAKISPKPDSSGPTIVKEDYDWDLIRRNVSDLTIINSNNDPWGCDDIQGRILFDRLGGTLIIRNGEGHMGSKKYNQPYREFPLLLKLVVD